ncbi:hypothetical protein Goarm_018312, partial [Gossypium armourianum]|nr:hypothetical protein [Gossypium armourianum]
PCGICGHYHKFEEGEVCGVCGHRAPVSSDKTSLQVSAFPSVILPDFLYLGSYDNASRSELLKTQGITRVLNDRSLIVICGIKDVKESLVYNFGNLVNLVWLLSKYIAFTLIVETLA